MNFTREPMILTIITPKEGNKIIVRNSSRSGEDYFVDAVELVSFGGATFYRSLERPKSFLLSTFQYEILEVKETKMALKNVSSEKSIKIGSHRKKETAKKEKKKKPKKPVEPKIKEGGDTDDEAKVSSSTVRKIIPPPEKLIKEKLERFKDEEFFEKNLLPDEIEAVKKDEEKEEKS